MKFFRYNFRNIKAVSFKIRKKTKNIEHFVACKILRTQFGLNITYYFKNICTSEKYFKQTVSIHEKST